MDKDKKVLARWESQRGKHWVEVVQNSDNTFGFRTTTSGGSGYQSLLQAMQRAEIETQVFSSRLQRVF